MEKLELYKIEEKVGEGSFGQVYRARRRLDGEIVGFKVIRKVKKHSRANVFTLDYVCFLQFSIFYYTSTYIYVIM